MSDITDFEQKIPISTMTEQRLHLLVLKHHLLDMRRAARHQYSDSNYDIADKYKIVKDVNKITTQGLFRLTKDSINYDNPVPGPNSLPDLDYAFLYVIPLTNENIESDIRYIRQYTLIATDGYTTIKTRLGTLTSSTINSNIVINLQWGKWRPYSDSNPMYELVQEVTQAKVNESYLSFGNYELTLPDPTLCKVGDVIRLDQWKCSGKVTQKEWFNDSNGRAQRIVKQINTYPALVEIGEKISCTGLAQDPVLFTYKSETLWVSNSFTITIKLFDDIYHWIIIDNDNTIEYRSEESIFEKTSPTEATYIYQEERVNLIFNIIKSSDSSKDIWSCNTYEFEIFNDRDIENKEYNYWCVFILNTVKEPYTKLNQTISGSFNKVYEEISSAHIRITNTSQVISAYIDSVSAQISEYISGLVSQHATDISELNARIDSYHPATPLTPTT